MSVKPVREPSADHPITVAPTGKHVTVRVNGEVVAESDNALTLQESNYPAVQYVPLSDVTADALHHSETSSYCPYKGDASYYSLRVDGAELTDAVWTYRTPYPAVAGIAGHVAFYPDKVQVDVTQS